MEPIFTELKKVLACLLSFTMVLTASLGEGAWFRFQLFSSPDLPSVPRHRDPVPPNVGFATAIALGPQVAIDNLKLVGL
jgi:hypothetical protein